MRRHCSHLETFALKSFNHLVGNVDARTGIPYFWTFLRANPPYFKHDPWDYGDGVGRRVDALIYCRIMTGSSAGARVEHALREKLYGWFGEPHGLMWRPETSYCKRAAEMMDQASSIFPVVTEFLETGSARAEGVIENLARGLLEIAQRDGKGLYFPLSFYFPDGWTRPKTVDEGPMDKREDDTWLEGDPAYYARVIIPLARYVEATGGRAARELIDGLAHYLVYQSGRFAPDGSFSRTMHGAKSVWTNGHTHSRFAAMAALFRAGRLLGREDYVAFARRAFEWGRGKSTSFGWIPEFVGRYEQEEGCETCTITDAIDAALQIAQSGETNYYEVAERFATNQLIEAQVWDADFARTPTRKLDTEMESYDRVADRALGGFAGWSAPNDLISDYPDPGFSPDGDVGKRRTLMDCCGGYGDRGLYLAWHHAVTERAGVVRVNMLLSRRTRDVTVESLYPYEDTLRITAHGAKRVAVRVPTWAKEPPRVTGRDGKPLGAKTRDGYLHLGKLDAGATVTVQFTTTPYTEKVVVGEEGIHRLKTYEVEWRGDRVVGISPPGRYSPLYNHRRSAPMGAPPACHLSANEVDW